MHAISLLHEGRQVYEGNAELRCDENGDDPHPCDVIFRISSAELESWAEFQTYAAPIHVAFDGYPSARGVVEGLLANATGARVLLHGEGLCPDSSHGGRILA